MQTEVLSEIALERIGEPVELRPVRQRFSDPQNSPQSTPCSGKTVRSFNFANPQLELRIVSRGRFDLDMPRTENMRRPVLARNLSGSPPDCCRNRKIRYYPPIKPEARSEKVRHSRGSGNPLRSRKSLDSRFRGNDGLKTTVGACGLSSLAVNLSHMLFRPENPVSCATNTYMSRIFCNWQVMSGSAIRIGYRGPAWLYRERRLGYASSAWSPFCLVRRCGNDYCTSFGDHVSFCYLRFMK